MTAQEIRQKYLEFMQERGHKVIPRALLVPQDDPTTLFTGSGMQPLIPFLLGEEHPEGNRLVDSQTCFRAEDMDEVGNNRHTTFFEMLGNWSLGDYFKQEQLPWFFEFLTDKVGLDPSKLYVTVFIGDEVAGVPKDTESAEIWKNLFGQKGIEAKVVEIGTENDGYQKGMGDGRIFYYDGSKNWWSRGGVPVNMPNGEPGGPDSEVFYDFGVELNIHENSDFKSKQCHPNCDCGRFLEIGNSVFMTYRKNDGSFDTLPKPNVDFGGGLERIAAASINSPDVFMISLLKPIIEGLERLSGKSYGDHQQSMRVIADHVRAAAFLGVDGVMPSNKEQGYLVRRLLRRAIRFAFDLGIEQDLLAQVVPIVTDLYAPDFPEVVERKDQVIEAFSREEKTFRQTLRAGIGQLEKIKTANLTLTGADLFRLYDTCGFPKELAIEEAKKQGILRQDRWEIDFDMLMQEQRKRSQTAGKGVFKGGLADHSKEVVKLHTATHLMYQALKETLGNQVVQRGSNITSERTRFDFSHHQKLTPEQIKQAEDIVNQKIDEDLPVSWKEESTKEALSNGASGAFGEKYGDRVKVYTVGDPANPFSREICGGPHVKHTGVIGEGGKRFKITKEEASSAGVRRVKAILE